MACRLVTWSECYEEGCSVPASIKPGKGEQRNGKHWATEPLNDSEHHYNSNKTVKGMLL